jgi:flagellar assembly factor FliW
MQGGILGFEHLKKYVILVHNEKPPFLWFQSVNDGAVAFVIINPQLIKADYEPLINDEEVVRLEIDDTQDVVLMAIVTIRSAPFLVTANLRAPIVINAKQRLAAQVVLDDQDLPIQYDITDKKQAAAGSLADGFATEKINNLSYALVP